MTKSRNRTISIRTSLLRTLVLIILAISTTVLAVMFFGSRGVVRKLSAHIIAQSSSHAEDELVNFFHSIERLVGMTQSWWDAGMLGYRNRQDLERLNSIFIPILDQYPQITSMMLVHDEGFEYLLFRDLRGGEDYEWYNRIVWADRGPDAGFETLWTEDLTLFREGPLPEDTRGYDPRERVFYKKPAIGEMRWTEPYYFFVTKDAGLTVASKWKDPVSGQTRLAAFDLLLMDLSAFTSGFRPSRHGKVFVMHGDSSIIGLPADNRWSEPDTLRQTLRNPAEREGGTTAADHEANLSTAEDLGIPSVAAAVKAWRDAGEKKGEPVRFTYEGEGWWTGFHPFDLGSQRLWVSVMVPERDFLLESKKQRNLVMAICAAALLAGILIAFETARRYSAPLEALARHTEHVRNLNLTEDVSVKSNVREISQLANASSQMVAALDSFARYVPLGLVRQLVHRGEVARIGGKDAMLTILFTDVAGFTNLAENMTPADLTSHMADYFSFMLHVLNDENATVDKFIGDAIVAFWGAPEPIEDHAEHAVRAVLRCRDLLRDRNAAWTREGIPPLPTRFGLCTGEVVVGNVGSPDRLNYTVLGDTVNLASRLEGLNGRYGTEALAADSVAEATGDQFFWRKVDHVVVKGRENPIWIVEPICAMAEATDDVKDRVWRYEKAFTVYSEGAFEKARELLERLLTDYPEDGPAKFLSQRCREYEIEPPEKPWKGVTRFDTKR